MRIFSSLAFLAVAVVAVFAFGACNSTERIASKTATSTNSTANKVNPVAPNPPDNARRINVQQAQDLASRGQAYFVDVRNQPAYDQGHIPGAKLIPVAEVANRIGELPRDKTIITYCSWPNEHTSAGAVDTMKAKGIQNAVALLGGFDGWKQAGLPINAKQ